MREGLHGLIGRLRPAGTALIVEDVCVPPERIAEGAKDLQALLGEHGFLPGVAGHASAGNLHFMLTPDFAKQEDLERYEAFMGGLVELIVGKYDGSLKAEHGTGVNMAPYVEREWGEKATELMWRVKRLADPDGVLSPGRPAQPRPRRPPAQPEDDAADRGVGDHLRGVRLLRAGLPEPQPDHDAAPADRPAPRDGAPARGLAGARGAAREFDYDALETCAADGSCQLACPLGIDTGKLVKELRRAQHGERAERAALAAAKRWGGGREISRVALRVGGPLARRTKRGKGLPGSARWGGADDPLRTTARRVRRGSSSPPDGAAAVYVPSCTNRIFGPSADRRPKEVFAVSRSGRCSCRCFGPGWSAGLDPGGRGGQLLRAALELERVRGCARA